MTGKERVKAALEMKEVDRLPFVPLLTPYALAAFPESVPQYIPDLMEYLDMDIFLRHISVVERVPNHQDGIEPLYYFENGDMITGFKTPVGTITSRSQYRPEVPDMPYITKHLVETVEDLEVFKYILEHTEYTFEHDYEKYDYEKNRIGERGEISTIFDFSPIQEFLEINAGIECTYNLLADVPDQFEEVFALLHERNKAYLRELVKCPVEYCISYENTGTTTLSPSVYTTYCTPALDQYADIIHQAGKKYFIHMCGKLSRLQSEIRGNRFDGVFDIAPEPTGDIELWEAREGFGEKVVAGGIDNFLR